MSEYGRTKQSNTRMRWGAIALAAAVGGACLLPIAATAAPAETVEDAIFPAPQQAQPRSGSVPLNQAVTIVASSEIDAETRETLIAIVADAGGTATVAENPGTSGANIFAGVADADAILAGWAVAPASGLPAEGYVVATGDHDGIPTIVLDGVDERGLYYASHTLRQAVTDGAVAGTEIRDWPLMSIRGTIEGFYGIPWSHQARLDLLEFSGEHKMNTYVYTPKDDLLLRSKWRTLYSEAELAELKELVDQATAHHVAFTFALSPGNDVCYSSEADFQATIDKFDQLRSIGVRSFSLPLDDIALAFTCDADRVTYPNTGGWNWIADAHTDYLNRVQREYIEPNGFEPLQTVPTNYTGSGEDPYKGRFGDRLDDDVLVQWTGEGVFSDQITLDSVTRASASYRTDHLFIWDNFPVNDGRRDRLFLNPLTGRDPRLHTVIDGFTANPMIQPYASLPSLAGYADYTWNGPAYDADASMSAVLRELAGNDAEVHAALTAFVDLNQSWPYRGDTDFAPALTADVAAFWQAREDGKRKGQNALRDRLRLIAETPQALAAMAEPGFAADVEPWSDAAASWATASQQLIAMLDALDKGNAKKATELYLDAAASVTAAGAATVDDQGWDGIRHDDVIVPTVGDGVFEDFVSRAQQIYRDEIGLIAVTAEEFPATASSSMGTYSSNAVERMVDGDTSSLYWSNQAAGAGAWVQVDLGAPRDVGSISVHQSDADAQTGDMIYHAALEYSLDGQTWQSAGTFTAAPLVQHTFDEAVSARYVRLRATAANPGGEPRRTVGQDSRVRCLRPDDGLRHHPRSGPRQ